MKSNVMASLLLATLVTACSGADTNSESARVLDNNTVYSKSQITMVTASNISIKMNYGIDYHNHSSNKPSYLWLIDPLSFEVTGLKATSSARVVFTNFLEHDSSGCGMDDGNRKTTYFVDLKSSGDAMVGNLIEDGFFIGDDGKSYETVVNMPATRLLPYCNAFQSKKQLVAIVVDGVWQTPREIVRDGNRQSVEGNTHDFELHLESY
jgi:hypothetical protein